MAKLFDIHILPGVFFHQRIQHELLLSHHRLLNQEQWSRRAPYQCFSSALRHFSTSSFTFFLFALSSLYSLSTPMPLQTQSGLRYLVFPHRQFLKALDTCQMLLWTAMWGGQPT
jgi:hypothetical protein